MEVDEYHRGERLVLVVAMEISVGKVSVVEEADDVAVEDTEGGTGALAMVAECVAMDLELVVD